MEITKSPRITLNQWNELCKSLSKNQQIGNVERRDPVDLLIGSFKSMESSVFESIDFTCNDKSDQILREHILDGLAIGSNPQVMDWLSTTEFIITCNRTVLVCASRYGNLETLKWYHTHFETQFLINIETIVFHAIIHGYVNIIEWISINICDPLYYSETVDLAVNGGHLEMLKFLDKSGRAIHYTREAINNAIKNNYIQILDWFYHKKLSFNYNSSAIDSASESGHFNVLEWFIENKIKLKYSSKTIHHLINNSKFDILEQIIKINPGYYKISDAFQEALCNSDYKVLDWFKQNKHLANYDQILLLESFSSKYRDKNFIKNIANHYLDD